MEINPCFSCVGSCCSLLVDIDKEDYNNLISIKKGENVIKQSEIFTKNNPSYKGKEKFLDEMYLKDFAIIKKDKTGFCSLLDKKTRLCSIYENRPKACIDFSNKSSKCKSIKVCIS
tara:strand:+ start:10768 stop:11115 length:348 start_codon:yes stop_codon:yes gene_type:complete